MNYWLVKSEPEAYSWADFTHETGTDWTGVRNYQARNNLQAMQPGDLVLFYHSVTEKAVVGVAIVHAPA
ncbi:MAG: EVE domain-containing protein, partial [Hymenobacter sp.]